MECEKDDFYENVVFRDSRIIFPLDLAAGSVSPTTLTGDPPDEPRPSRVRPSVLEAFDPAYGNSSLDFSLSKNLDLLLLEDINLNFGVVDDPPPPPLPPRSERAPPIPLRKESNNIHHYDSVSSEDGKANVFSNIPEEVPSLNGNATPLEEISLSSSASSPDEENENFSTCPLPSTSKNNSKVKGLLSKMYTKEWLKNKASNQTFKEETNYSSIVKKEVTDIGICDMLSWSSLTRKDPQPLWTELKNGVLSSFPMQKLEIPIHVIRLGNVLSIGQLITPDSLSNPLSFELISTKEKNKAVLSFVSLDNKLFWMKQILKTCTTGFCPIMPECYQRAGKAYIKTSVSGEWQPVWLLLQNDPLKKLWIHNIITDETQENLSSENLHKVRSVSLVKLGDSGGCSLAIQPGRYFIVNWFDHTLYIQCDVKSETENWYHLLRLVALESGSSLEDHQMTAEDVPVLVECCIKYIETYGVLSEGIYRRSGVQSKVQRLLQRLKSDAWNQHISNEELTEHDVANVLKRFFRTLPEPLLTNQLYSQWIDGLNSDNHEEQLELYKTLLKMLPDVNRCTLRKLLGHLHVVQNKCEKNLMSVGNLAAMWGPNLMTVDSARNDSSTFGHTDAETDVVLQLIQYYPWLFDVDREKLAVNDAISQVQEQLEQGTYAKKSAGDIRTWIKNNLTRQDMAVEVGPRLKVSDVLPQLLKHSEHNESVLQTTVLMEVICDEHLQRPMPLKEPLLPAILKWSDWSQEERKNNHLLFDCHPIVEKLMHFDKNVPLKSVFKVYYSNPKAKSFRQCPFEFCQARFTLLKDLKNHSVQGRWNLENIIWYLGCDSKLNAPTEWCITFIEKDVPLKKGRVHIGHCLSFATEEDFWMLVNSVILTEIEGGVRGFTPEVATQKNAI